MTGSQAKPGLWTRLAGRRTGPRVGDRTFVLLLCLPPALLLFTLLVALPMGEAAWYSFFRWNGFGHPTEWLGFRNFVRVLGNPAFHTALVNNGLIIAVSLLVQLPLALGLAVLLADRLRGTQGFRLVFFLPYILAEIAAGLQQIDRHLYEAARLDGAGAWQLFRLVTVPLLAPTIRLSVFFSILGSLQLFDLIMPLTKGGPSDSTQTIVSFLYNYGVTRMQIGFGSAVGVVLFVICLAFSFGYKRFFMRQD